MVDVVLLVLCQKRIKEKGHKNAESSNETTNVDLQEYGEIFSMNKKLNEFIILVNELLNNGPFVSIK